MARRERRVRREEPAGLSGAVIGAICGGGVLLLAIIVVVIVMLANRGSDRQLAAAPPEVPDGAPVAANPAAVVPPPPVVNPGDAGANLDLATLNALKRSSVFIKAEAGDMMATGSGFLARVEGNTAFIVTNHHVVAPPASRIFQRGPGMMIRPPQFARFQQKPRYTLVFNSGTPEERSFAAEVAADDAKADLAVLRIATLPPGSAPIPVNAQVGLVETMPVFILGFPFGEALATTKGGPAITVGKGSVSSIRKDDRGEVSVVQINGDLNPGNSGGPVVDARGRLVGIAVATVKGTQIGLAIPAAKLGNLLATAPLQGEVAVRPADPQPIVGPRPVPQPKPAPSQPLTDQDLDDILRVLASKDYPQMMGALGRLTAAKPVDAQRPRVLKALEPLPEIHEWHIDINSTKALGIWGTKETVPLLVKLVPTDNVFVRHEAIRALGLLKDERAAGPVAQRLIPLQDRMVAGQTLKQIGPAAEKAVWPLLKHNDLFVRHEACKVLGDIGTQQSLVLLGQAAGDQNGLVRMAAQNALRAVQQRKQ
jgi:S1-C subfamily serine protease